MPTEATAGFGTSQLFLTDSRLVLAVANHLRYQALNRAFGVSRDQANVVTAVLLLGAADGAYEATRRITGARVPCPAPTRPSARSRCATRRSASPGRAPERSRASGRSWRSRCSAASPPPVCGQERAAEQRLRAAEERVRRERIRRYSAARDRVRATPA